MRLRARRAVAVGSALALLAASGVASPSVVTTGPYQVRVDRLVLTWHYNQQVAAPAPAAANSARRTAQIFLSVYPNDAGAAQRLWAVTLRDVIAGDAKRSVAIESHGNPLDAPPDDTIRAVIYLPNLPLWADRIRQLSGELEAFERAEVVRARFPFRGGTPEPETEVAGVRVVVRSVEQRERRATVRMAAYAPPGAQVVSPTADQTWGVRIVGEGERASRAIAGTVSAKPDGSAEFTVILQEVPARPEWLEAEILLRSGRRVQYPFRLTDLPLPLRLR